MADENPINELEKVWAKFGLRSGQAVAQPKPNDDAELGIWQVLTNPHHL